MGKHRQKRLYVLGGLGLLLLLSACKKEVIPPDIKEEPKFYTDGRLNGDSFHYIAGQNNYRIEPDAYILTVVANLIYLPIYTTTFTNDKDSFIVALIGGDVAARRDVADEAFLNTTLELQKFKFEDWLTWPGVYIQLKRDGKRYSTFREQIPGAHFDILSVEDYQVPGTQYARRKVDVSFKCLLQSEHEPVEYLVIEDAKATLLFTYDQK